MKYYSILFISILLLASCTKLTSENIQTNESIARAFADRFLMFFCTDRQYTGTHPCDYDTIVIDKQSEQVQEESAIFTFMIFDANRKVMDFFVIVEDGKAYPLKSDFFGQIAQEYIEQGKLSS